MAPQYEELVELLIDGARFNDAEDVQAALDQGADINSQDAQGRTGNFFVMNAKLFVSIFHTRPPSFPAQSLNFVAVHMAAANGHADLIQGLIDRGAVRHHTNNVKITYSLKDKRTSELLSSSSSPDNKFQFHYY